MKRILMLLAVITVIISCNKAGENEYIISGTVKGIADGKTVILEKQDQMGQFIPMDTVKVKDGKFTMKGSAKEPEIMLIQVEALQGKVPFVLENGDINIIVDKDSLQKSKFSGTYNNDVFSKFNDDLTKFQKELIDRATKTQLDRLKNMGFKTFEMIIDESYDMEPDPLQRFEMIKNEIIKISKLSVDEMESIHKELYPILIHNRNNIKNIQDNNAKKIQSLWI
jgi:hypothetical protein